MAKNDIAIEALKQNFNKIDRAEGFDANSIERKLRKLENQKINNFDFRKTPPTPEEGQDGSIVFVAGEDSVAMKMMVKNKNRWFSISLPSVMQVADVSSAHTPLKFSPYVVTTTAQGTSGTTAVTCNSAAGTIQYYKATSIAANGVSAFQVNNSFSRTDSIYLLTVQDENAGESITIYQIPKSVSDANVDESSHVNLNNMLTLAVIDYLKAQLKDSQGDIELKEYYMREFWKKIGDNESNKRNISVSFPASPFALK